MSEKLRSVNTKFWDDTFISDLNPSEKLLFLYLLTNSLANILGIYEITIKRISYDTGLTKETIAKGLESFAKGRKAFHTDDNYIIMPNWLKNQRLNTNMKVAVAKEFNALPKHIKDSILSNGSEALPNDSEGFRMVMECLDKYEIEIEEEIEDEGEVDSKPKTLDLRQTVFVSEVWNYENLYSPAMLEKFCNYWTEKNQSGKKMRFELERTFEIPKRLVTWHSRDREIQPQKPKLVMP
jgi:hypothetical protein